MKKYTEEKNSPPEQYLDAKTAPCFNQCDGGKIEFTNDVPNVLLILFQLLIMK